MKNTFSILMFALLLSGCAALSGGLEPPDVSLKSVRALPAQGLEQRFELVLGLANPNDRALEFDGISLQLELNGQRLGRAMSNKTVSVGRLEHGEVVLTGVVSVFDVLRSALSLGSSETLEYRLHGRLHLANSMSSLPFSRSGTLDPEKAFTP